MEQRRLLLAFGLSLLLLTLYQELVANRYRQQPVPAGAPATNAPAAQAPPERPKETVPVEGQAGLRNLAAPADADEGVLVETDNFRARITKVGARLGEIRLKHYRRSVSENSEPLDLVTPAPILPVTLHLGPDSSDAQLVYRADRTEVVARGRDRAQVVFTAVTPAGLQVEKRYVFTGDVYTFDVETAFTGGEVPKSVGLVLTPVPLDAPTGTETAITLANRKTVEKPVADVKTTPMKVDAPVWAGFAAQYFLSAVIPQAPTASSATMTAAEGIPIAKLDAPVADGRAAFTVYMGPKDRETLAAASHDLDRALDFGWFWFIAIPLLQALRAIHAFTGNYGIAIVVLTTLVKVVTIPLTQTTFRNMREMQKIQPQMLKLRERFKDDQAALQKEMMELYRRHRVNPLSGCLPMLLQLPIFVGLYNALLHAIELRHAPFAFWIKDLSAPEWLVITGSYGIPVLTILMGASMFAQQWLTPQQGDPTQQKMMMFMPLIFTFMFINFPAGLVLYWLVNNILSIGQQYIMLRSSA